jgi:hypothetical protein
MDVKGNGRWPNWKLHLENLLKALRKPRNLSGESGVPVEIRNGYLQNAKQKHESLIRLVRLIIADMIVVGNRK